MKFLALVALLITGNVQAQASEDTSFDSKAPTGASADATISMAAWRCSVYAAYAKMPSEEARLFRVGYEAGQRFLEAAKKGDVSQEEAYSNVPMIFSLNMRGPTLEFILGRIYSAATGLASDEIIKQDDRGLGLSSDKWIFDDELQRLKGKNKYYGSNCQIIK